MAESEGELSPLEKTRRRLYTPTGGGDIAPPPLSLRTPSAPQGWIHDAPPLLTSQKPKTAPVTIFFFFALAFFVIAVGLSVYFLVLGGRSVSADHITITVDSPLRVAAGDAVSFPITIRNNNPVAIQNVQLRISFPEGTYSTDEHPVPLTYYSETIDSIPAGGTEERTVRAIIYGNEDQRIVIPVSLEYRTESSNAVFTKETEHELSVGTSPVNINVKSVSEVSSGQTMTVTVEIRSNSATQIQNVAVLASLPPGFLMQSAEPEPEIGSYFNLGSLDPGEEKEIRFTGILSGQDRDVRIFRFEVGAPREGGGGALSVVYTKSDVQVKLTKPFLAVGLELNRSDAETLVIPAGEKVQGVLSWENTLSARILDAEISVALAGQGFDMETVRASGGFYRSQDNTILFSEQTIRGLENLGPGDTGNGSFDFEIKKGSEIASLRNPSVTLTLSIAGRRVAESGVSERVFSTLSRTIKIASDLQVSSHVLYSTGPFANSGPWPPEPNQETTYTVMLYANNSVNSVANGTVTMTLPPYVRFTGQTVGSITYNETGRKVTWDLSDVAPGIRREAAFQIGFTPSVSQRGMTPPLVSEQTISGFDRFVGAQVTNVAPALDTRAKDDPAFQNSFGEVKK